MNAQISEKRARDAIDRGTDEEQRHRMKVAQIMGRQMAGMSAGGVDVSFGSAYDTLETTAIMGELDAIEVRRNAAWEAYDYRVQGFNFNAQAELQKSQARSIMFSGIIDGLGHAVDFSDAQKKNTVVGNGGSSVGTY